MPGPAGVTAVAPRKCYYAAIDGTKAKDSAVFGALLEKHRGWRNLLKDFLAVAKGDPRRLDDPRHPFLPICLYDEGGTQVAVVSPVGRDALGTDPFWATYPGRNPKTGAPDPVGHRAWSTRAPTVGRHTAAEESALYMSQFMLRPQVEIVLPGAAGAQMVAQLPEGKPTPGSTVFAADLLYVSSHGWLGGFAGGDHMSEWAAASPPDAQGTFPASIYFSVGKYADAGEGFSGPKWIILAQCSTVNSATWPLWARVLARSNPHVRGILAYEETAPPPEAAAGIARTFFDNLDRKQSFLDAWKGANRGRHWAAIVHQDAREDRLDGWGAFAPLADVATTATVSNYRGYIANSPNGERIFDAPPPFELVMEVWTDKTSGFLRVTSANLGGLTEYCSNGACRLTIRAPRGERIQKTTVRWIHIRPSHAYQPSVDELFVSVTSPVPDATIRIGKGSKEVEALAVAANQSEMTLDFLAPARVSNKQLHAHHSYLWPHVELETNARTSTYDFKTVGLLFFER
ncbi:hypothetical protein [Pendulispora albinea]|uniref:Uncharacterized protein n=1 Tax=Pendulispora albinea TaxID=2741071 RepID=A0ABZ2LQT9_9BACT